MRSAKNPLLEEPGKVQPFPYFGDSGVQVNSKLESITAKALPMSTTVYSCSIVTLFTSIYYN